MALSEYSVGARDALLEHFPGLRKYISPGSDRAHLHIRLPHRIPRFDLLVTTERDEITFFVDRDHQHIATRGESLEEDITEAKRVLAGLLSGSLLLCKDVRSDTWHFYHPERCGYDPDEELTFSTWRELAH